jgi:phosphatidylglycerol lysyltransferase
VLKLLQAPPPLRASPADLERASRIIQRAACTYPNLAYRGDKALLFSPAGNAMLMYGRMRQSWIAMGDPVGPDDEARELVHEFRAICERVGVRMVVFEAGAERLPWYRDLGLRCTKIGEEARIDLERFDLARAELAPLRHKRERLLRGGCRFEIVPRGEVAAVLGELEGISREWLTLKHAAEKSFSSASFDADYLRRFPMAIVRSGGEIVAFANLWLGSGKAELSVDLMRHRPQAPNGTMDFLFTELLLWARREGYRRFNFGMAPLAGLDAEKDAPLWRRIGTLVYRHGEHFYNFRGLRAYKAKFQPCWTPLYVASPADAALPLVLLDVAALVAGGYAAIVSRHA